ncbi:hypothetical protein CON90_28665 [Bacillus toyonensis]|nr:hypothetical protein CON90_28665 [Bacillus toyonensis]
MDPSFTVFSKKYIKITIPKYIFMWKNMLFNFKYNLEDIHRIAENKVIKKKFPFTCEKKHLNTFILNVFSQIIELP